MVVVCRFQLVSRNFFIAVKMAANLPYCISASYLEPIYTREWTRSLFRPFLVFRRFQLVSCDLRIAVKMAPKPTVLHFCKLLGAYQLDGIN